MTRQIVLDTETTGKEVKLGNRIIEIGAIELVDRKPTGRTFHYYINPEGAPIEEGAFKVHGISADQLKDKPTFRQISEQFLDFIRGADILIHNAKFDTGFINDELTRIGKPSIWEIANKVECTLLMAQSLYPKQRNGLDVLCERLGVDNSQRVHHGALLDAELLADVFLRMTENAAPFVDDEAIARQPREEIVRIAPSKSPLRISVAETDLTANSDYLAAMEKDTKVIPVWKTGSSAPAMKR